jgi:hypothetical protein
VCEVIHYWRYSLMVLLSSSIGASAVTYLVFGFVTARKQ